MSSEVVLLISILCLVKCTWCGNYEFAMGKRHSNDEVLHEELLTNSSDSNKAIIEYVYIAKKPVTYIQVHTDTNIYTEVSFINSRKMYIKLFNFENLSFNATLTVYGFPWHPDGPVPRKGAGFLLLPKRKKSYLNKSSVEESGLIATNGAYMSQEEDDDISSVESDYGDYDNTSNWEGETNEEQEEPESIINVNVNSTSIVESRSVVVKFNFLNYFFIYIVFVTLL